MAIELENKPNVEAPSATYPYGDIKDDTGLNDGTPVNKLVHADFHQFFAALLDIGGVVGGIVPNGLPENADNGFQYILSLNSAARLANRNLLGYLAQTIIGVIIPGVPYSLIGLNDSGTAISTGYIYYGGDLYSCNGLNYGAIVHALQFNKTAENVLTITDSATPGLFQYSDLIFSNKKAVYTPTLDTDGGGGTFTAGFAQGSYLLRGNELIINVVLTGVTVTGTPDCLAVSLPPGIDATGNVYNGYGIASFNDGSTDNQIRATRTPSSNGSGKVGIFPTVFGIANFSAFAGGTIIFQVVLHK